VKYALFFSDTLTLISENTLRDSEYSLMITNDQL